MAVPRRGALPICQAGFANVFEFPNVSPGRNPVVVITLADHISGEGIKSGMDGRPSGCVYHNVVFYFIISC
jgi:hypothetical protein